MTKVWPPAGSTTWTGDKRRRRENNPAARVRRGQKKMDLGKKLVEMSYQIIYNSIMIPAKAEKNIQAVDQTLNTEKIT
ncbi:MAG: hypothetical protein KAT34_07280, partial [Candidatus Aminicenantes bacterium]|nr:hypothetical protein [Candidatus Aminicenantes bacterium]